MSEGLDLGTIDFKTVLRMAWKQSGLTLEELAHRSGIPLGQIVRYINVDDDYYPNPYKIVALSRTLNTTILIDWLYAQLKPNAQNFNGYFKTTKEITDVINELTRALEDGKISEYERRKLLSEIEEALKELNALKEHLIVGM